MKKIDNSFKLVIVPALFSVGLVAAAGMYFGYSGKIQLSVGWDRTFMHIEGNRK